MRTHPLPVLSRVKRVLCGLSRFRLLDSQAPLSIEGLSLGEGEELLGIYYNAESSMSQAIMVTSDSLLLEDKEEWQKVPYASISKVLTPKTKIDVRGLQLILNNGNEIWLPVHGGTDKTSDAFEFLRFINRVVADRASMTQEG